MKVTSILSFLFCISSVVMPVVHARANVLGLKRSPATKSSSKHLKVFDASVHQQRRSLHARTNVLGLKRSPATKSSSKRNLEGFDAAVHQQRRSLQTDAVVCEALSEFIMENPSSGCMCNADGEEPTDECYEFLSYCSICDTLEGERTCLGIDLEAEIATGDVDAECETYTSGLFDNTICIIEDDDGTCTITIDGTECTSCALASCGDDDDNYDLDCSNVIAGEKWNLCTDDIPETSRFLAFGNNDRFEDDLECADAPTSKEICEAEYEIILGPNICTCTEDGEPSAKCDEFLESCATCDTLEGERTCFILDTDVGCATYMSGPFDNTICAIEDDVTCSITLDGTECASCESCGNGDNYDLDCSNVIPGEKWNLCTDDIPETSRFLAFSDTDRFEDDFECADASTSAPTGGFALSFHALFVVGLIVVATFW